MVQFCGIFLNASKHNFTVKNLNIEIEKFEQILFVPTFLS